MNMYSFLEEVWPCESGISSHNASHGVLAGQQQQHKEVKMRFAGFAQLAGHYHAPWSEIITSRHFKPPGHCRMRALRATESLSVDVMPALFDSIVHRITIGLNRGTFCLVVPQGSARDTHHTGSASSTSGSPPYSFERTLMAYMTSINDQCLSIAGGPSSVPACVLGLH
jgi:hypothetical protein